MRPGLIRKLTELLNFQDKVYRRDRFLQTEKGAEIHCRRRSSTWQKKGKIYAC